MDGLIHEDYKDIVNTEVNVKSVMIEINKIQKALCDLYVDFWSYSTKELQHDLKSLNELDKRMIELLGCLEPEKINML